MAVGNAVYPIDTSALDPTIYFVFYDSTGPLGSIQHLDRPGSLEDFTDPTPYLSYLNQWYAAAAADTPPLTLAQAIALKQSLLGVIYAAKRQTLTTQAALAQWSNIVAPGGGGGSGTAPGNGFGTTGNFFTLDATSLIASGSVGSTITTDKPVAAGSKCYWEINVVDANNKSGDQIGVCLPGCALNNDVGRTNQGWGYKGNAQKDTNNTATAYGSAWVSGDTIGVALDLTNGQLTFYRNGVSQGVAFTLATGSNVYYPAASSSTGGATYTLNLGGPFAHAPPAGFGFVNPVAYSASDNGAIDAALGQPDQIGGTPQTPNATELASIQAQIVAARQNLLADYNAITANLAACASIAAVIAFDITAGWA